MRSPWQVLKSFASRSKADEKKTQSDEAKVLPAQVAEALSNVAALTINQTARAQLKTSPVEETEPEIRLPQQVEIKPAEPSSPAKASERHEPPAEIVATPTETTKPSIRTPKLARRGSDALAGSIGATGRVAQVASIRAKPGRMHEAAVSPEPPAIERAAALDQEIQELRSRLSAKLREQNNQMKALLDRYDS
ncbi:hypothetical protein B5K11_27835 [Rhizobium leguminosarum bv. trifolii]|uniref:hypothetical protein n=1 Tax=Rhizobium leguminosarum TaxID=384 RepID=UPI000E39B184|nr:hypothetical protein [Rhizobium leguminosarum]RFB86890.1 hypothetical protein B5K11_27835 [Rhizobium leguminosarum bv. trifolii]